MINTIFKHGILTAAALAALASAAHAGGFSRGEADTEILYEDGAAAFRAKATFVAPQRGYDTINGATATDGDYTNNYFVPSLAGKARITDNFSCAGTYTQPFGASSSYGPQARLADQATSSIQNHTIEAEFTTNEYGLTCAANFDLEKGRFYILGGVFLQSFDYEEVTRMGTLRLKDESELGYRVGAAYSIPEIALRAEVMYRSQVDHKGDGSFTLSPTGSVALPGGLPPGYQLPAVGAGSLPQSLRFNMQTGIAPGWLAFGSVKWTDWSVLPTLNYTITGLGDLQKNFRFRDGWTIMGGVGHSFTDDISGAVSLTWDRGVGTGADIMTDTWTVGLGTAIKTGPGELRIGGAVSYLTSGSQTQRADLADFNATVGGDFAYGANVSYLVKF
ncbi:outer membrane protein transport protein [Shinella sp. PSBB067]|uniref:outer membrane protein transport protein n=1 Tax=Shinella sp. PSBB067 TaxID=2715959 RepID=UPI00193B726C|nr:outer membrane protein transport protein [Shinella sp. PSBB067]QRI64910.1 outer membrane protein transport protein [Shinella sp. PSBB067]